MSAKRKILCALCLLLSLALMLGACSTPTPAATNSPSVQPSQEATATIAATATPDNSPLGKYDPAITITTIRSIDSQRTYMPGETWDNNIWTKAYEEKLGIKFSYLWTCDSSQFNDKLNTAIASDDLPEYLPTLSYNQYYQLAKAGKLADITSAYDSLATPYVKNVMSVADNITYKQDCIDGKLYGIGLPPGLYYGQYLLYYRDDWAANLNLQQPKTFDDVIQMAYAFARNDPNKNGTPTVGFGLGKSILGGGMNAIPVFAAYNAYPSIWVNDGAGKLVFGAIQPAVKDVLLKMQQWYKDGVIDKNFFSLGDWTEIPDNIVKENIGMAFGVAWFPDWKCKDVLLKKGDKSASWTAMPIPADGSGTIKSPISSQQSNVVAMTTSAKHPEAVVKMVNLLNDLLEDPATSEGQYHDQKDPNGKIVDNFFHAYALCNAAVDPFLNVILAQAVQDAIKTGDTSKLDGEAMSYYQRNQDYQSGKDLGGYMGWAIYADPNGTAMQVKKIYDSGDYLMDAYTGPNTENMNANWGNLTSKRDEIFSKIIAGAPISEFDTWLQYWQSQGGDAITKEVNDWYAANK